MKRRLRFALAATLAACLPSVIVSAKLPLSEQEIRSDDVAVTLIDLTPRFLDFYEKAAKPGVTPDQRFALWEELYGFAAVPPTPEGKTIARRLLDEAWDRYPAALDVIRRGAGGMQPSPDAVANEVRRVLGHEGPFSLRYVVYVGGFEGNAFTAGQGGVPMIAMPVEMASDMRRRTLRHEMTHAVHGAVTGLSGGWERSIAQTIISEGLAMHTARSFEPDMPENLFIEHKPGWLAGVMPKAPEILRGIAPHLASSDSATVLRFTMGKGTTGAEREAYVAGWLVVGHWLKQGRTLADIARIPEAEMVTEVGRAIAELQTAES